VNVVDVEPAGIDRSPGTLRYEESDETSTTVPPAGAGPVMVTVPVLELPPGTVLGEHDIAKTSGGVTVSFVLTLASPMEADIVAVTASVTGTVVIEKVAVAEPAGTVTLVGGLAAELVVLRLTTTPLVDAAPVRVTVPKTGFPPATGEGDAVTDSGTGGSTVRSVVISLPLAVAVMIGLVLAVTGKVATTKLTELAPPGTVTVVGGAALGSFELIATTRPAVGAGPVRVSNPDDVWPPYRVVGFSVIA